MNHKQIETFCVSIIIAFCVFNTVSCETNRNIQLLNKYLRKADFLEQCSNTQAFLKPFFGQCYLDQQQFYKQLKQFVEKVNDMDGALTLDEFLRNKIFSDFTKYFRDTFKDNQSYLKKLDELEKVFKNKLNALADSTSSLQVKDMFSAFSDSGFDLVIIEIKNNETLYEKPEESQCQRGGTCSLISKLFGLNKLDDLSELTITEFLRSLIDKAYTNLDIQNEQIASDKDLYDQFFTGLDEEGIKGNKLQSLQNVLSTDLTTEVIYYFVDEASKTTRLLNTTKAATNPPRTTTVPIKVIDDYAVSNQVLIAVPVSVFFLGIIMTILVIYFVYDCIPITSHLADRDEKKSSQKKTQQQNFELNNINRAVTRF